MNHPETRRHRDQETTSRIMSNVKSKGSRAELALGKAMWDLGLRYRKHVASTAGRPDFAFPWLKLAVFCDGDFWHGKGWRERGFRSWEEQFQVLRNGRFWREKIAYNILRDQQVNSELEAAGWKVLRFLESDILRDPQSCAREVFEAAQRRQAGKLPAVPPGSKWTDSSSVREALQHH